MHAIGDKKQCNLPLLRVDMPISTVQRQHQNFENLRHHSTQLDIAKDGQERQGFMLIELVGVKSVHPSPWQHLLFNTVPPASSPKGKYSRLTAIDCHWLGWLSSGNTKDNVSYSETLEFSVNHHSTNSVNMAKKNDIDLSFIGMSQDLSAPKSHQVENLFCVRN